MEQKAYLSEVQALPLEQREKLINTLLKLGNRRGVRGQRLTWEELFSLRPELKVYSIPTLRHYLELCDSFWLLQSVETDEEGFFQKGVTEWGENRRKVGGLPLSKAFVFALAIFGYRHFFQGQILIPALICIAILGALGYHRYVQK